MATRSIMTSVNIKGQKEVQRFVGALEKAKASRGKQVKLKRELKVVSNDDLPEIISLIKF